MKDAEAKQKFEEYTIRIANNLILIKSFLDIAWEIETLKFKDDLKFEDEPFLSRVLYACLNSSVLEIVKMWEFEILPEEAIKGGVKQDPDCLTFYSYLNFIKSNSKKLFMESKLKDIGVLLNGHYSEIEQSAEIINSIKKYRNKMVAHLSKKEEEYRGKNHIEDILKLFQLSENIITKYYFLYNGNDLDFEHPELRDNYIQKYFSKFKK